MSALKNTDQYAANDYRAVKPTNKDLKRDPGALTTWREDVDRTISIKEMDPERAAAFRAACGY